MYTNAVEYFAMSVISLQTSHARARVHHKCDGSNTSRMHGAQPYTLYMHANCMFMYYYTVAKVLFVSLISSLCVRGTPAYVYGFT